MPQYGLDGSVSEWVKILSRCYVTSRVFIFSLLSHNFLSPAELHTLRTTLIPGRYVSIACDVVFLIHTVVRWGCPYMSRGIPVCRIYLPVLVQTHRRVRCLELLYYKQVTSL